MAASDQAQHCVVHLVPTAPKTDDGVISASLEEEGCYATLEAALEVGTDGEVDLPDGTEPGDLTQALIDVSITLDTEVLLGTEYDGTSFDGGSNSYFAPSGCANTTWQVANVGSTWNDRFESGRGFGTCDHNRKFEHQDFGGSVVLCTPNCGTYGGLRDEVTSLRWKD
jgi:hypothetical protein